MAPDSKTVDEVPRRWPCPSCGEYISIAAIKCRFCGERTNWNPALERGTPEEWNAVQRAKRNQIDTPTAPTQESDRRSHDSNIELLDRHDSGLFGAIWRGRQVDLNRPIAVKIIFPNWANVTSAIDHAKALARLNHANVVTVHQVASVRDPESGNIVDAVVMEWLDGEHLGNKLAGPQFAAAQAHKICTAIIDGLEHMHGRGLVHGDLHAGNVFVADSAIKIIDISYADSRSLQLMSNASRETRINADIDSARYLCRRVAYHTHLAQASFRGESELSAASSLPAIHTAVRLIFAPVETSEGLPRIGSPITPPWLEPMRSVVRDIRIFAETFDRESTVAYGRFPNAEQVCRQWAERLRALIHREQLHSSDQRAVVAAMIEICDEVASLYQGGLTMNSRGKVSNLVSTLDKKTHEFAKKWLEVYSWPAHARAQYCEELVLESRRLNDILVREAKFGIPPSELQASATLASDQIAQIVFSSPSVFGETATAELQRIALALYDVAEMIVFLDGGKSLSKIRTGMGGAAKALEALLPKLA